MKISGHKAAQRPEGTMALAGKGLHAVPITSWAACGASGLQAAVGCSFPDPGVPGPGPLPSLWARSRDLTLECPRHCLVFPFPCSDHDHSQVQAPCLFLPGEEGVTGPVLGGADVVVGRVSGPTSCPPMPLLSPLHLFWTGGFCSLSPLSAGL